MQVIKKYYIINSFGNIEWVPNFGIAKKYTSDPTNKEWYKKEIYTTEEDIVLDKTGKAVLRSNINNKNEINNTEEVVYENCIEIFTKQAEMYNKTMIEEFSKKLGFENMFDAISWKDSSIKQKNTNAKRVYGYREKVYTYFYKCLSSFNMKIKNNILEDVLLEACNEYVTNFPMYKD